MNSQSRFMKIVILVCYISTGPCWEKVLGSILDTCTRLSDNGESSQCYVLIAFRVQLTGFYTQLKNLQKTIGWSLTFLLISNILSNGSQVARAGIFLAIQEPERERSKVQAQRKLQGELKAKPLNLKRSYLKSVSVIVIVQCCGNCLVWTVF